MEIQAPKPAQLRVVWYCPASGPNVPYGVLLWYPTTEDLYPKFHEHPEELLLPEDLEVIGQVGEYIESLAREIGAAGTLQVIDSTWSNVLRVSDATELLTDAPPERLLEELYRVHVQNR
jgi:hypothetical protein